MPVEREKGTSWECAQRVTDILTDPKERNYKPGTSGKIKAERDKGSLMDNSMFKNTGYQSKGAS